MTTARKPRATKEDRGYSYDSAFPTILRGLLEKTNTTQEQLAESLGIARQSVAQWKDGKTMPDIYYLDKIADYFKVSADYLLGRAENMTITSEAIRDMLGLSDDAIYSLSKMQLFAKRVPLAKNNLNVVSALLSNNKFIQHVIPYIIEYTSTCIGVREIEEEYSSYIEFLESLDQTDVSFFEERDGVIFMKNDEDEKKRQRGIKLRNSLELKKDARLGLLFKIQKTFTDIIESGE